MPHTHIYLFIFGLALLAVAIVEATLYCCNINERKVKQRGITTFLFNIKSFSEQLSLESWFHTSATALMLCDDYLLCMHNSVCNKTDQELTFSRPEKNS
jgi:hypothetical protein